MGVFLVFWAGVVSFASPCFLPVVPVFITYLAGRPSSAQGETDRAQGKIDWAAAGQAVIFMIGFSAVFIALWSAIGLIGYVLGDFRVWLRIAGGIVLIIVGLHATGLISIKFLDRVLKPNYSPERTGKPQVGRSLLLGLAFGAGWTPCIGPILGGVLGLASTTDSLGAGILLMVVYSLGLGLPFVAICAGASTLMNRLKWFTAHQRGVNIVVGLFLIVVGFLMIADLFSRLAGVLNFGI